MVEAPGIDRSCTKSSELDEVPGAADERRAGSSLLEMSTAGGAGNRNSQMASIQRGDSLRSPTQDFDVSALSRGFAASSCVLWVPPVSALDLENGWRSFRASGYRRVDSPSQMDPHVVERIPGFQDWILSRESPSAFAVGVAPLFCAFSRMLGAEEASSVRGLLDEHVRLATTYSVRVEFSARLEDVLGAELERLRAAIGEARFNGLGCHDTFADLEFGEQRAAAEEKLRHLAADSIRSELRVLVASSIEKDVSRWQRSWLARTGRVEELLRPAALSERGFLGPSERLAEVLARDAATVEALGVTHVAIADRMRAILEPALRELSDIPQVVEHFEVSGTQWRGYQACPWGCPEDVKWSSIDVTIRNARSGEKLDAPGLIIHLLSEHQFFEGLESPYRVAPEIAVKVLELGVAAPTPT